MKSKNKLRALSPFLAWPTFIARQPASLDRLIAGLVDMQWQDSAAVNLGSKFQLGLLLGWATTHVPFYRETPAYKETLQRLQSNPDNFAEIWQLLPELKKTTLRERGEQFRISKLPQHHGPTTQINSSGSTGVPVEVLTTAVTRRNWSALTLRDHLAWQRDFKKRSGAIRFLGEEARNPRGVSTPGWGKPVSELYNSAPGGAIHVGHSPAAHADWLLRLNPHYLIAYPSIAEELLEEFASRQTKPSSLEEIRFMSEPLDEALRKRFENEWQVRCADMYSANEVGYIALSCPEYGKLHVQAETVFVELINDNNEPCAPGETGRVVVTNLHNLATPLIRFDLGDYGVAGEPCACGRSSMVIERVLGRVRNYAFTPAGEKFWPGSLGRVRRIEPILQFQYVQRAFDRIELRVVLSRPMSLEESTETVQLVRQALEHAYRVEICPVEALERGPTGKFEEFLSLIRDR